MSKLHKNLYTDKVSVGGVLQPAKAKGKVTITAGKLKSIKLQVAQSEGRVPTLVVKQSGGTAVAFDVELLDSKVPHHNAIDINGERAAAVAPDDAIELYRVIPKQTAAVGVAVEWRYEHGYPYLNSDSVSNTENERFLYLTIIPTAAGGATDWDFALLTDKDID